MRDNRRLREELGAEINKDYPSNIPSESFGEDVREEVKSGSRTHTFPLISGVGVRERAKQPDEYIEKLGSTTSGILFDEGWSGLFGIEERIRSEFRQLPETRWIQNLRHPTYCLRQPIPILIQRTDRAVTATYDDIELYSTGNNVKEATSDLCAKIVVRYKELKENAAKSQEYTFLKRIIEEIEPPAWQELKQLYREKLEEIPYVQEGYINIDGNNADVILVLSEYSVDRIEQLAEIDLEINLKFRPLSFFVEYKFSEDYLELNDFECFY